MEPHQLLSWPKRARVLKLRRVGRRFCGFSTRVVKRTWCVGSVPRTQGSWSGPTGLVWGKAADSAIGAWPWCRALCPFFPFAHRGKCFPGPAPANSEVCMLGYLLNIKGVHLSWAMSGPSNLKAMKGMLSEGPAMVGDAKAGSDGFPHPSPPLTLSPSALEWCLAQVGNKYVMNEFTGCFRSRTGEVKRD